MLTPGTTARPRPLRQKSADARRRFLDRCLSSGLGGSPRRPVRYRLPGGGKAIRTLGPPREGLALRDHRNRPRGPSGPREEVAPDDDPGDRVAAGIERQDPAQEESDRDRTDIPFDPERAEAGGALQPCGRGRWLAVRDRPAGHRPGRRFVAATEGYRGADAQGDG